MTRNRFEQFVKDDPETKNRFARFAGNGPVSRIESFASGAADAATFGWGDEILGAVRGGFDADARDAYTRESRDQQDRAQFVNPVSYGAGQLAGAVGGGVGVGGVARLGVGALGQGARVASLAAKAGPLTRIGRCRWCGIRCRVRCRG
jgi:hypothetical protein